MISDATVWVGCDGDGCSEEVEVDLPFTYPDHSGENGRYDHRPSAVNPLAVGLGMVVDPDDEDRHYCESCWGQREDKEAPE